MNLSNVLFVPLCVLVSMPIVSAGQEMESADQAEAVMEELGQDGDEPMTTGLRHYRQRDFQSALSEFEKVTELAPWRADAFYLRGYCLMVLRNYEPSVEAFGRAFELDPAFDPRTIYQR